MSDPVCHVPPETPKTQPTPVDLPSIPPAEATLASLQHTVNQMRQVVIILAGQQGAQGARGAAGRNANEGKKARWTEESRQTETVKIFNPQDNTQFVTVERINQLKMKDGITGESWTWDRTRR